MTTDEQLEHWSKISNPLEALEILVEHWGFIGTDPYYRELNDALYEMAFRCAGIEKAGKK